MREDIVEIAERESNDIETIEQWKRQFDALNEWASKPKYDMQTAIIDSQLELFGVRIQL